MPVLIQYEWDPDTGVAMFTYEHTVKGEYQTFTRFKNQMKYWTRK